MGRYDTGYVPLALRRNEPSLGDTIASAITDYRQVRRQDDADAYERAQRPLADALRRAQAYELGINLPEPSAPPPPETAGTRLRKLLATLGGGGKPDAAPSAAPAPAPGGDMGARIGGFAGGTLADALARQPQSQGNGPLPPTMQQPAAPPAQAPRKMLPGQFDPATGGFSTGQPAQPPAPVPLGGGFALDPSRTPSARQAKAAEAERAAQEQVLQARFAQEREMLGLRDATDRAQLAETGRHNRAMEGLAGQQEQRMAQQPRGGTRASSGCRAVIATDGERKAAALIPKAEEAARGLDRVKEVGSWDAYAGKVPLIGNKLISGTQQEIEADANAFLTAILRPESGATITEAEMEQARRQFVPRPGDTPQVLTMKREARQRAIQQLRAMGGRATPGAPASAPGTDAAALYEELRDAGKSHEDAVAEVRARTGGE